MSAGGWMAALRGVSGQRGDRPEPSAPASPPRAPLSKHLVVLAAAIAILALAVVAGLSFIPARARGDEAGAAEEPLGPTAAQTKAFLESGKAGALVEEPETDLRAAQTMPHRDLERAEALELAEAVFEPEIEHFGGLYDQLESEKFLSNHAAVVPMSSLPGAQDEGGEGSAAEHPDAPVMVESNLPLRAESESGKEAPVDLELERSEGELRPKNPLTEVGIPEELGEGVSLPGADVEVKVAGSPEARQVSDVEGQFAFYPQIAQDTDLVVAPTAQGVEMMTDIRSAEAPMQTTYSLELPSGSELRATAEGGAEVTEAGRTTVAIPPPTAIDAAGNPVPTELKVSAEGLTVTADPTPSTSFPVMVDPAYMVQGFSWRWGQVPVSPMAWHGNETSAAIEPFPYAAWGDGQSGLDLTSGAYGANATPGTQANWEYWVPRYQEDVSDFGNAPTSFVHEWYTEGVLFLPWGNYDNYPALVLGLIDPTVGWQTADVHYGGQGEMSGWENWFRLINVNGNGEGDTHVKAAAMNMVTYESEYPAKRRDAYIAGSYVAVEDDEPPHIQFLNPPEHWMNQVAEPIGFQVEDGGLGVSWTDATFQGRTIEGAGFNLGCNGSPENICPRRVKSTGVFPGEWYRTLKVPPATLPTGRDPVTIVAADVVGALGYPGHAAEQTVVLRIDHTAPEVTVAGSLTEQGSLGTHRPSYALRVNAKDGVEGAPQSGIKKVEIRVDGKPVALPESAEWEPNCQTQNCPFNGEWTMNASEYGSGPHEVQVFATDAVGNVTTKTLQIELHQPPPTLSVSGTMTEQATLGTELPSYKLKINASASAESPTPAGIPTYSSSFGTSGTGNGQFTRPGGMAIDAQGDLWVADSNDNRVEEFSAQGAYLRQFGTKGSGNGQLSRPTAVAIAANGDLWVTDSGNKRVEEFSPTGAYLAQFGSLGTENGKFAGSGPEAIAIDYHGNIWVADTYGGRLEKFNENGIFIRSVATRGKGPEQLGDPDGIAIGPGGNVFVSDWEDDKVAEYGEGGGFIRQFGSQGNEPGQLENPTGIAIDSRGDVWVPDQKNGRVEEFNQGGEYLGRFGAKGTGAGQFELTYPTGIATDTNGDIWVTDWGNNRVEKWVSGNYVPSITPTYMGSFGTAGTGAGHFSAVDGLAVDAKGDIWATDINANLVQKFTPGGELLGSYGGTGTGNGQYAIPTGPTVNSGHVWIADFANNRIQELSESGTFLSKFGTTGTQNGPYFERPAEVAVDPSHHLWVADEGNNRVEELTETGSFIRSVSSLGAAGSLNRPAALAIGPGGKIWISDYGNHRIVELSETGAFLRQFGGNASELGSLGGPIGLAVDSHEDVWVADSVRNRVFEFNGTGEYVGQFGTSGSGPGALDYPRDVALDGKGHIFVSDTENHRIEEWAIPPVHSQISTEVTVDGKRVEATEKACEVETCSSANEWTLQSSSLSPGSHTVVVRATDGLGNSTSKTMTIKVGDVTKPSLEVGGELASAPAGWIEQEEGDYALHAAATDSGFGVTSLVFTLDGKSIASKTQACSAGGCSANISTTVNAHGLAAGAHPAEVVATDGAGNMTKKIWTVNVDPEGSISTEEAEATFEAFEATSPVNLIGEPKEEEEYEGTAASLGVKVASEGIEATGSNVPLTVSADSDSGIRLEILDELALRGVCAEPPEEAAPGEPQCVPRELAERLMKEEEEEVARGEKSVGLEPITIVPIGGNATGEATAVEGVAAVSTNTAEAVDTVTRPLTDGGLTFEDIRSSTAPEHYAFEISPYSSELELQQVSPQKIEAVYKEGGWSAFTLEAEPAHDADGHSVPTHLTLNGPLLVTLTVEHRGISSETGQPFVYPVVAGTGWQGGWFGGIVEHYEPPPPSEPPSETGEEPGEELVVSAPEPSTPQQAGITDPSLIAQSRTSTSRYFVRHIRCGTKPVYWTEGLLEYGPERFECGNPFTRTVGTDDSEFSFGVKGYFYLSPGHFVSHAGSSTAEIECPKMDYPQHYHGGLTEPNWFIDPARKCEWWGNTSGGNGGSREGVGKSIIAYGEWNRGEGEPGSWKISQLGTAIFISATNSSYNVEIFKTTCIPCHG
jgi:tripartite motif-containing protein 71